MSFSDHRLFKNPAKHGAHRTRSFSRSHGQYAFRGHLSWCSCITGQSNLTRSLFGSSPTPDHGKKITLLRPDRFRRCQTNLRSPYNFPGINDAEWTRTVRVIPVLNLSLYRIIYYRCFLCRKFSSKWFCRVRISSTNTHQIHM